MNTRLINNLYRDFKSKVHTLFSNRYDLIGISWGELKRIRSLSPDQINDLTLYGGRFYFKDSHELLHALEEIFFQELYKIDFKNKTPYIIDCGTHIGVSILYYKHHCPGAKILAFEPDQNNFSILAKNKASYNWRDVELRQEAVWIDNTTLSFANEGSMSSKIDETGSSADSISIKATRLKDLLNTKVDFLKMDIEGAEYEVVKDIAENLHQVENLFIEYHGSFTKNNELNEILQTVNKSGFSYYIKEANPSYPTPFSRGGEKPPQYDLQLNIFCFRGN